ncbi:5'(3')-deoxyribonucleotidase, cytosolic type-like [Biomphalaria glabrata]|uniref:5'(3')-deoxyribonucleotidase, cytosolic type-like n=1 Tax=Biomphalaria glabrata TaxID=6526 RepID=A0A9W2ZRA8_BIOGL|nr:5'(3')-deoxyribonucleotidase, cytosolic type-like [Biomphalaria glabrata]
MAYNDNFSNTKAIGKSFSNKNESSVPKNIRVLVDFENVLCDFEQSLLKSYRRKYPKETYIPLEQRKGISVKRQYADVSEELGEKLSSVYCTPGFISNLPEIPGACEAVDAMDKLYGVNVFIYSGITMPYGYSLKEKCQWVEFHLGVRWLDKIIFTKDPTLLNGNLLIDDRVSIKGVIKNPTWEHVVFTSCHNVRISVGTKTRLENWTDGAWRQIIRKARHDI